MVLRAHNTEKVALSESAKVDQISSLAFPRFRYRSYHTVGECVGFWEKNAYLNLVRARMERLISALRWKRKDSRLRQFLNCHKYFKIVRIARNTGVAVTRACSRASAAENPMLHVE